MQRSTRARFSALVDEEKAGVPATDLSLLTQPPFGGQGLSICTMPRTWSPGAVRARLCAIWMERMPPRDLFTSRSISL